MVRRRRGPDRSKSTEPSPSKRQISFPSLGRVVLEWWSEWSCLSLVGLIVGSYWDVSRDLINPGWVTQVRGMMLRDPKPR